jgi:hypothetical protein
MPGIGSGFFTHAMPEYHSKRDLSSHFLKCKMVLICLIETIAQVL